MGDRYAAVGTVTPVVSDPDSMLALNGVTTVRGRIYDLGFGSTGTPADNATQWRVARSTTAVAVGGAVTESALDINAPASQIIAISDITTEPGYDDVFIDIGLNQRASWRWVAAPEGEIMVPADATSAIGIEPTQASGGVNATGYIHWLE